MKNISKEQLDMINREKVCWHFGTMEEVQNPLLCIREDCVFFDSCVDITKYVYYRNGKKYKKLKRWEVVKEGTMIDTYSGELLPISENFIGKTLIEFSDERDFFDPII